MRIEDIQKHSMYILGLLIIICVEYFYEDSLYDLSMRFIENFQTKETAALTYFFTIFSSIGEDQNYFVLCFFIYNSFGIVRCFQYLLFWCSLMFICTFGKIAYNQGRPFYTDDLIYPINCSGDYGNPSGHATMSAGFATLLFLDLVHSNFQRFKLWQYFTILFIAISYAVIIGFARMYQGLHAINQVIYGWQLGIWAGFYFNYCLKGQLISHLYHLPISLDNKLKYLRNAGIALAIYLLLQLAVIAEAIAVDKYFPAPDAWYEAVYEKCGVTLIYTFAENDMKDSGKISIALGAYLGILINVAVFNIMYKHNEMQSGPLNYLIRLLILILISIPFYFYRTYMPNAFNEIWLALGLIVILGSLLQGITVFSLSQYLYKRLKIVKEKPELEKQDNRQGQEEHQPLIDVEFVDNLMDLSCNK